MLSLFAILAVAGIWACAFHLRGIKLYLKAFDERDHRLEARDRLDQQFLAVLRDFVDRNPDNEIIKEYVSDLQEVARRSVTPGL